MKALCARNRTGEFALISQGQRQVANWVSEHSMQRNSVALLSANIADTSVELHTESMKTFHLILETYANVGSSL